MWSFPYIWIDNPDVEAGVKAVQTVIAESVFREQEFMGRTNEVSYEPPLKTGRGL
jgi:hypothetical protein